MTAVCPVCRIHQNPPPDGSPEAAYVAAIGDVSADGLLPTLANMCGVHRVLAERFMAVAVKESPSTGDVGKMVDQWQVATVQLLRRLQAITQGTRAHPQLPTLAAYIAKAGATCRVFSQHAEAFVSEVTRGEPS